MSDIIKDLLDFEKFTRRKANNKLRMAAAEEIERLRGAAKYDESTIKHLRKHSAHNSGAAKPGKVQKGTPVHVYSSKSVTMKGVVSAFYQ